MSKGTMILLSGGLDSTVLASALVRGFWGDHAPIEGIFFEYGQRHQTAESHASLMVSDLLGIPLFVYELPLIFLRSPLITASGMPVPLGKDPKRSGIAPTYVPRRNTVLLAIAAAVAEQHGLRAIAYGAHATDANYPDCTPRFADSFRQMLRDGSPPNDEMVLMSPFIQTSKTGIVEFAFDSLMNVPLEFTHSCYLGKHPACGVCDTCQSRIAAFKEAGQRDPIEYDINIDWST